MLLLERLLGSAADRREDDRVVVGDDLHRVRIDGLLPLDNCLLRLRRRRFENRRRSVGMFHHLMENLLLRLGSVGNMV